MKPFILLFLLGIISTLSFADNPSVFDQKHTWYAPQGSLSVTPSADTPEERALFYKMAGMVADYSVSYTWKDEESSLSYSSDVCSKISETELRCADGGTVIYDLTNHFVTASDSGTAYAFYEKGSSLAKSI